MVNAYEFSNNVKIKLPKPVYNCQNYREIKVAYFIGHSVQWAK